MGITTWIILVKLCFLLVNGHYPDGHYEHWMRSTPRRPVDVMIDVINDLGVNILQQYHVPGNVAFSPTGLGFVLIALYEGSAGRGSKQIGEALHLPHDHQITRIGLRDIHRRLRSYLNADSFLGGLNLNKDNTRLRPEYEDILRFYGFDFTMDDVQINTTDSTTTANLADSTTMGNATISTMQSLMDGMTTMNPGGSTNQPAGNDTTTASPSTGASTTTAPTTIPPTATTLPTTDGTVPTTTNSPTTTIDTSVDIITVTPGNAAPIMQATPPPAASANSSTTPVASTIQILDLTLNTTDLPTRLSSRAAQPNLSTSMIVNNPGSASDPKINRITGGGIVTRSTPSTDSFKFSPPVTTEATTTEAVTSTTTEPTTIPPRTTPASSTAFSSKTTTVAAGTNTLTARSSSSDNFRTVPRISEPITSTMGSRMTTGGGSTASMLEFETVSVVVREFDSETTTGAESMTPLETTTTDQPISTTTDVPSTITDMPSSTTDVPTTIMDSLMGAQTLSVVESPSSNNVRRKRSAEHYFSTYPDDGLWMQHLNIWRGAPEADEATVRDSKQVAFLVNGCDVASVSAATYTAVLPFAYFPSLKAVAVEFPLDNPRYNIILFLPTERPDTLRLARDLSSKSLRLLREHLQPTWIRATIPSFMLKGFVTLTPFLQRMGIRDVFEPIAADLSPMTPDVGVYARDVQQSIGVNIRNYMEPDRTTSRESTQQEFPLIVPPRRDSYRFLYPGNGLLERAGPVSFIAEHPFLYFIIDTETSVTLIAGRIDDPLNSRIL